jgi:hypothetical protein
MQVAELSSWVSMDPVLNPLLRKSGNAENRTLDLWIVAKNSRSLDDRGDLFPLFWKLKKICNCWTSAKLNEETTALSLALSKGPNSVGVSLSSSGDGNIQYPKRCFLVI